MRRFRPLRILLDPLDGRIYDLNESAPPAFVAGNDCTKTIITCYCCVPRTQ